jgi:hypothetical protein
MKFSGETKMKTAIALFCAATLGFGVIGCTSSDSGGVSDNGGYGTANTAGKTVPGSENTSSTPAQAAPGQSQQTAQQGVNPNADNVSNGPNTATGQGNNNTQDAVSPTK